MILVQISQFLDLTPNISDIYQLLVAVEQNKKGEEKENGSDYRQKCAFFNKELW